MTATRQRRTAAGLVLSVFPGIDLLGRAFEEEGYCVVRGPDLLWGGDVRTFHPPAGVFEGVIGGPPCKGESPLARLNGQWGETLAGEFARIVAEAEPTWWVMEAVKEHTAPHVLVLNNRWLGEEQNRRRYFHSNVDLARWVEVSVFENPVRIPAVLAVQHATEGKWRRLPKGRTYAYTVPEACEAQGLPSDFTANWPFRKDATRELIGNGVPMAMGRAVAKAVRRASEE